MFKKGDQVKITSSTRKRTIFQGAEITPGTTKTHHLDVIGTITNIFDSPFTSYEVKVDGQAEGQEFIDVGPGELEKI